MTPTDKPRMLEGIRVIDLTTVVFGPYCTQILSDLGADVIKIEAPEGDVLRYLGTTAKTLGMGSVHMALSHGKRSVALDLKKPEDQAVLRALVATADVFIHNVRKAAISRLGFWYDDVKDLKPDLIYTHCVGFGSDGPYGELQAYDDVIQAASGTATLSSRVDGNPKPRFVPSLIADKIAGMHAAYAILAALFHRERTSEGQFIEVPMFEAFTNFMLKEHLGGLTFDPPVGPVCYARQIDPNRQPFPTSDGYVSIVPYTDIAMPRLFAVLGAPEVLQEEQFATRELRARNISLLYDRIARLTPKFTTADLSAALEAASIPAMPVRDMADIQQDPHLQAVGFFDRREHGTEGGYYDMKAPVKFSAYPAAQPSPAPLLGEHNAEILREIAHG